MCTKVQRRYVFFLLSLAQVLVIRVKTNPIERLVSQINENCIIREKNAALTMWEAIDGMITPANRLAPYESKFRARTYFPLQHCHQVFLSTHELKRHNCFFFFFDKQLSIAKLMGNKNIISLS